MSAVSELEAGLQAMQGLKPPGVSGSRITSLTALCVANVQSESVLIQKLYTHFKKAPGTHKLGVLYVVDSVTRKWLDQARQQGQAVDGSAPDGTYAAGVNRVTELIPVLMNDIVASAPADQKDKIKKLVDIWEKGQTFPPKLIESFKEKLQASQAHASTTPPGSPPPNALAPGAGGRPAGPGGPPALPPNIMETLANLAKQSAAPAPPPSTATPPMAGGLFGPGAAANNNNNIHNNRGFQPPYSAPPPAAAPVNAQPLPFQIPQQQAPMPFALPYGAAPPSVPPASNPQLPPALAGLAGLISAAQQQAQQQQPPPPQLAQQPPQPQPQPGGNNVQQNLWFIQALLAQGMSLDQVSGVLAQVAAGNASMPPGAAAPAAPPSLVPSAIAAAVAAANAGGGGGGGGGGAQWPPHNDWNSSGADRGYGSRSPGRGRGRSRSRSPGRYWGGGDGRSSPRGRRSSPGRDRDRDRDWGRGGGRDYRQRSPNGSNSGRRGGGGGSGSGSDSPLAPPPPSEKWVQHDPSLPSGTIRVLSRTLFVGGVTVSEPELRAVFARFGDVQTCIVNKEKRHAFVKMYSRRDAEAAKAGMEYGRTEDTGLRTRWGVGFGPRDCSDYSKGVSVIPIAKLTEADRKWLLTAPWGGSGGRPISTGLVVEEPDIEIGAGVSSKAISRRMQTDRGGLHGPRSTRRDEELNQGHGAGGPPAAAAAHSSANAIPVNPNGSRRSGRGRRGGGGAGGGGGGGGGAGPGSGAHASGSGSGGDELNYGDDHTSSSAKTGAAAAAALPYGLTMGANGVPVFPPGFAFPAPQ